MTDLNNQTEQGSQDGDEDPFQAIMDGKSGLILSEQIRSVLHLARAARKLFSVDHIAALVATAQAEGETDLVKVLDKGAPGSADQVLRWMHSWTQDDEIRFFSWLEEYGNGNHA